jgi:PIN domain nuclease of toxin-antitoxin system
MRLLLDTHTLIWWLATHPNLSVVARDAIADDTNEVHVSAVSAWEIATKHRIGKLPGVGFLVSDMAGVMADQGFLGLPVSVQHGLKAGDLPGPHRDPFDRMLIAQAMAENLVLLSNETIFDRYGVKRLW